MNEKVKYLFLTVVLILLIFLIHANYWSTTFWQASLLNIMTMFIACFVTYYWKERKDDVVRRNSCIESVINEIEVLTMLPEISSGTKNVALSKQVACANRIKYLKDAGFSDIQEDVNYIDDHFEMMRDLYSPSKKVMDNNIDKFKKQQELVAARCVKIRINLYTELKKK